VDLSNLQVFRLSGCDKLENLPAKFEKLQSLVGLDLFHCFELQWLPDSIVDLSKLQTFRLWGCDKLENCQQSWGNRKSCLIP
jgi:hypothetical protein